MAKRFSALVIDAHQLAAVVRNRIDNVIILDSRSFLEYNVSHVINAVNVGCAKLMKRRLQQDKLSIQDFLAHNCHWNVELDVDIIVYDQNTEDPSYLVADSFMAVFLQKLLCTYSSVNMLKGGFLEFQACYPNLCEEDKTKYTPLTSLSQPCLPISDHGPTRILSFLYLGSQHDALNKEVLLNHNINYELNVSTNCPKPDFIQEAHFMRIPVIDNYSEKLLPYFPKAFQFLDKVRESGGCALVHCLAGISRSATVAIAYIMRHMKMTSDDAYRYVKTKRATISPNFNFLGQLLEYEKQLQRDNILASKPNSPGQTAVNPKTGFVSHCENALFCSSSPVQTKSPTNKCSLEVPSLGFENSRIPRSSQSTDEWKELVAGACTNAAGHTSEPKPSVTLTVDTTSTRLNVKGNTRIAEDWGKKCIPVSSLKELNFTPCQAVVSKSTKCFARESNSWSAGDSYVKASFTDQIPVEPLGSLYRKRHDNNFDLTLFENILSECKVETFKSMSTLSSTVWSSEQEVSVVPQTQQVGYDAKEYKRSDSTSTSGLGSEGSDCMDSWNDYHSSCERETDMDDDYGAVPMEDDDYQRKIIEFQDSYEEASLYPKYEDPIITEHNSDSIDLSHEQFVPGYSRRDRFQGFVADKKPGRNRFPSKHLDLTGVFPTTANYTRSGVSDKKSRKADGLYRAQSCPGILSHDPVPWSPSSFSCIKSVGSVARRTRKPDSDKAYKNRYSCSSLDYMEYTSCTALLKSCPDVPSCIVSSSDPVASLSPPHQIFQHNMIQVS